MDQIPIDDFAGRIVETVISMANEEKRRPTSRDVKRGLKSLVSKGYAPGVPPREYIAVKATIGQKRDGTPRVVSKSEVDRVLGEKEREAEKIQTKAELERLKLELATAQTEVTPRAMEVIVDAWRKEFDRLQASGNVREFKAWIMQFVFRVELGYNRAKILYTYPMMDLFSTVDNLSNTAIHFGGTSP